VNQHSLRRHAGRAVVEFETELQRLHDKIQVRIGTHDEGIAAAQFHRGWDETRRELREYFSTGRGGTGEDNFVRTRVNGRHSGFGRLRQERDKVGIKSRAVNHLDQCPRCEGAAHTGLEQHRVAAASA
jgi:hypothetical protein